MRKSNDLQKFFKIVNKMYPLDDISKIRLKYDFYKSPMVKPLKDFFDSYGKSDDQRAFLTSEQLKMEDPSFKMLKQYFPMVEGKLTQDEWNEGLKDGMKVKKWLQNLLTDEYNVSKQKKQEIFNTYYMAHYEKVLTHRTSQGSEVLFMITKNPIDMFFCSANQSFGSCMQITGTYSDTNHIGLIQTIPDPSRFMVAKVKGYRFVLFDGELFKIPNVVQRSWASVDENNNLAIIRWFGGQAVEDSPLADAMGLENRAPSKTKPFEPYSLFLGCRAGKATPIYYVDKGGIRVNKDRTKVYFDFENGRAGACVNLVVKDKDGKLVAPDESTFKRGFEGDKDIKVPCITDSFSSTWSTTCHKCGQRSMEIRGNHKCPDNIKLPYRERIYIVKPQRGRESIQLTYDKLLPLLRSKDIVIENRKLILKGVA